MFITQKNSNTLISIKLIPNSASNTIVDATEEYVKIKISAPAIENKANKSLILFLSDFLKIPKSKICIDKGEKSKLKKILIKDTNSEDIIQKFLFVLKYNQNNK